ncbi:hypothetical protein FRB94_003312 [Tulasnella sp. JGI-2019a]|nr:hypothetical protein FRB93_014061 [Tulasnella sp. JGI-2019a]KAG9003200.1 hypothetical protein FRB94_003312 [Tulasnella sp. JGI-2019a]
MSQPAVLRPTVAQTQPTHPAHPLPPPSTTSEDTTSKIEDAEPGVDVNMLRELGKRALVDVLNSVNGAKTLVLDSSLAGPLGLVTEVSLYKQHGVDKMVWLEQGPLNAQTTNIIYLCRPQIKWMRILAEQIKAASASSTPRTYNLVLVPRRTILCDRVLEEEGVFGEVTITSYKLEFIPVEDDLISLEWDSTFKEIFLDGDETSIYYAAQALLTIQQAYGLFPRIVGKGDAAKKLANLLIHLRAHPTTTAQANSPNLSTPSELLDSLVIIDRSTDMITPLLTQLTYEGLVDELMGITNSYVEVEANFLNPPQSASASSALPTATSTSTRKKKHRLTSATDQFYGQIRDANFAVVGVKLNREAKRLDSEFKSRHQAQTVGQLRSFVGKLGGLQSEQTNLGLHTELSERISVFTRTDQFNKSLEIQQNLLASYDTNAQVSAIEDLIAQQAPVQLVLRLLCLASITCGGIKLKQLETIKREILQTYGYDLLPLLLSLTSLSLLLPNPLPKSHPIPSPNSTSLKPPPVPQPFPPIRKALRVLSDTPEASPTDISYVYSGYAPITVRMVQAVAMKGCVLANLSTTGGGATGVGKVEKVAAHPISGWKGFEDAMKLIPGAVVDEVQRGVSAEKDGSAAVSGPLGLGPAVAASANQRATTTTTTCVFFLGGCTYTEIAALRWMSKNNRGRKFLICTTGIINGSSLLESLAGTGSGFKFPSRPLAPA